MKIYILVSRPLTTNQSLSRTVVISFRVDLAYYYKLTFPTLPSAVFTRKATAEKMITTHPPIWTFKIP